MDEKVYVVFWEFRGLRESIVKLLEYCEVDYESHTINKLEDDWPSLKAFLYSQGVEFPNLPYISHRGKVLSESMAIKAYIAQEFAHEELLPQLHQYVDFLEINGIVVDLLAAIIGPAYASQSIPEFKVTLQESLDNHSLKLQGLAKLLKTKKWLLGDQLSILDFRFAETIEVMLAINEDLQMNDFGLDCSSFRRYFADFSQLPRIAAYKQSSRYEERPYFSRFGVWR